jgi:lysozyme
MDFKKTKDLIVKHEGLRLKAYTCPAGKITIGVGRNLEDKGISEEEADFLLHNDIMECMADMPKIFWNWNHLNDEQKMAMIDMRFNLGPVRFRQFRNMIEAVKAGDFKKAAEEMRDSQWYKQVGKRADNLIKMMTDET